MKRFWILALLVACKTQAGQPDPLTTPTPNICIVDGVYHMPNPEWTPGALCTPQDTDFDGYRYHAHVAHCKRRISMAEKDDVARLYGIPKADYHLYEFDHFIPLNAGGSNSAANLWPQPLDEAKLKDDVEQEVYTGLRRGTMTQDQGVALIRAWHSPTCP